MGEVYVYAPAEEDLTTIGICGAIIPEKPRFHEIANGISEVKFDYTMDQLGKYRFLQQGYQIKCDVPVRTTPEIANGQFVSVVEKWTVKNTATKANRYIYNGRDTSKSKKKVYLVPVGGEIIVVAKYEDDSYRWKVKYTYSVKKKKKTTYKTVSGYMDHGDTTLQMVETRNIPSTSTGIEEVAPSWEIEEQIFRITSVKKTHNTVSVTAQHISYDLMYNLTSYNNDGSAALQQVGQAVLDGCFADHQFTFQTNLGGSKTGHHYANKDPITALLDPDIGMVPRWGGQLIRDNYSLTVLDNAGVNRGMIFTYGKNVSGIDMNVDVSNVASAIRPIGENENGTPLYLAHSVLIDENFNVTQLSDTNGIVYGRYHHLVEGALTCDLPHPRIFPLEGDSCKVDSKNGVTAAIVRNRLLEQAIQYFKDGCETPEISVHVDLLPLGYSVQWAQYRDLMKCFLFDTVKVFYPPMDMNFDLMISEIEWDFGEDRPVSMTFGALADLTATTASWQIQSVNGMKLVPGSVSGYQLGQDAISTRHIQAESITADQIAAQSITANKLAAGSVTAEKIAANAVKAENIEAGAITAAKIAAGSVSADNIAANAITAGKIAAGAITASGAEIADAAIKTANIQLGAITSALIAASAVGTSQIADASITDAKIVGLTANKITAGTINGNTVNVTNLNADNITAGTINGQRIPVLGSEKIADGAISGVKIENGAVTTTKLGDNVVTADKIVAGAITSAKIASEAVTANHILANTITGDKIAAATIEGSNIKAATITANKLAADVGASLDLSSNVSVNVLITRASDDLAESMTEMNDNTVNMISDTRETVENMQPVLQNVTQSFSFVMDGIRTQKKNADGTPATIYSTLVSDVGFDVEQEGEPIWRSARGAQYGEIINFIKPNAVSGSYISMRRSADGGIMFIAMEV